MIPPLISADDRGLTLGVGLFETILFVDGAPRYWEAHIDRLRASCIELGLPAPQGAALEAAAEAAMVASAVIQGRAAVRLSWTGGSGARGLEPPDAPAPRLFAQATRAPETAPTLTLATVSIRRNPASPTSRHKTLSYLDSVEARREARAAGADEALLLDMAGSVACAAAANIFWLDGARLCTPPLICGVLPGVIRAETLRRAASWGLIVSECEARPIALNRSQGVFITNSLVGGVPIYSLDGAPLPPLAAWLLAEIKILQL